MNNSYIICSAVSFGHLAELVNEQLAKGYIPIGGVSVKGDMPAQAMVLLSTSKTW